MLHYELRWRDIDEWINSNLSRNGFDLSKEISTWSRWEDNSLVLIYEQEDGAKVVEDKTKRPAYLKEYEE